LIRLQRHFSITRKLQKNLLKDYIDDIAKHSGKLKLVKIEALFKNIPVQLARESNSLSTDYDSGKIRIPEIFFEPLVLRCYMHLYPVKYFSCPVGIINLIKIFNGFSKACASSFVHVLKNSLNLSWFYARLSDE